MKIRLGDGCEVNPKYTSVDMDRHGNVRVYVRRHGRKTRIRETPGTDEFMAAYRAALANDESVEISTPGKRDTRKAGSLRWLIEHYYRSAEYRQAIINL